MARRINKVTTKGQVVIPKDIRDKLKIKPSTKILFEIDGDKIIMEPLTKYTAEGGKSGRGMIKTKIKATDKEIRDAIARGHVERYLNSLKNS